VPEELKTPEVKSSAIASKKFDNVDSLGVCFLSWHFSCDVLDGVYS